MIPLLEEVREMRGIACDAAVVSERPDPQLGVSRNGGHAEQGLTVRPAVSLGQHARMAQERGASPRALVERPGALVSKDAVIEAAWPGNAVEEYHLTMRTALTVRIEALRKVLDEVPGDDSRIETMPRAAIAASPRLSRRARTAPPPIGAQGGSGATPARRRRTPADHRLMPRVDRNVGGSTSGRGRRTKWDGPRLAIRAPKRPHGALFSVTALYGHASSASAIAASPATRASRPR
jgi:hypothetical protein